MAIRADYFNYNTKTLEEAWHRPTFKLTGTFRYNVYEKIVFGSNIYFISGMRAKSYTSTTEEVLTLSGIIDLNLSVQYLFSDRLGAFLRFDNILGKNYERYYRYPSRGIQIIGGVSINF
jgi:outer membrane cobalamin receptor